MTLMQDVKMHVDVSLSKWFGLSTLLRGLKRILKRQDDILLDSYVGPIAIMRNCLSLRSHKIPHDNV
jgi:hypothetical protein